MEIIECKGKRELDGKTHPSSFIKMLNKIKEKLPQNNTKCTPKKRYIFLLKVLPPSVLSPSCTNIFQLIKI